MSSTSTHLSLPYLQGGQAQKHVTHNEALRQLDRVVQLGVAGIQDTPPAAPAEGARYIVGTAPVGDWAGQGGAVAQFEGGAWQFTAARPGWIAYDLGSGGLVVFGADGWGPAPVGTVPQLGVNASADATNRLAVASDASLFSHDGGSHRVKVNKASAGETASLLFQSGWSGRAEMGLSGSDDFEVKVSPDGSNFHTAMTVSRANGSVAFPNTALASPAYLASFAGGLVANATGLLGGAVNVPAGAVFDAAQAPDLPGAWAFSGHFAGAVEAPETIAVDPNRVYRLSGYLRQQSVAGDWSGYTHGDRHAQYIGLRAYDADGLQILAQHHARYRHGGTDSLTALTQPLAPGDTEVHVADASGWNESDGTAGRRGLVIFGYRSAGGQEHAFYSRIEQEGLFDLGGVDKASGVITLNAPLPAAMGNPGDAGGVWPAGMRIANRMTGFHDKYALCSDVTLPASDAWHEVTHAVGGIDASGGNVAENFAPGTVAVRPVLMMNYTNRAGGFSGYPDTGAGAQVWVAGLAMNADPAARAVPGANGARDVFVLHGDSATGAVSFAVAVPGLSAL